MKDYKLSADNMDVLMLELPYISAPTELYAAVCQSKPHTLLLESAEIHSKQDLKSLMLVDAALRVVCRERTVEFEAQSSNGINLLNAIYTKAESMTGVSLKREDNALLTMVFAEENRLLDEDARLHQASPFDALRAIQQAYPLDHLPDEAIFIAGLFAYDLVAQFEPLGAVESTTRCPDFVFYVAETLLVIDHQTQASHLHASVFGGKDSEQNVLLLSQRLQSIKEICLLPSLPLPEAEPNPCHVTDSVNDDTFCATVEKLKQYVYQGDVFQVVPSRQFLLSCSSPLAAYVALKKSNPSPYMFYMQDKEFTLFGASPESALKYEKASNQVEIYPIAGTRPRGKHADGSINLDLDGRIELELRNDVKENAEHMMLVDLARNDVARISKAGTRYVADLLKVDRYSHVMHLVSRVVGQLDEKLDALHAYQACMNMGTLTGAPKIRAMQLIRDVEQKRRGSYGGAVGYLTGKGDLDTCIVIRSAYVEDGIAYVQAGAGVVFDSVPQAEADETRGKAQAVISAIQTAHQGVK